MGRQYKNEEKMKQIIISLILILSGLHCKAQSGMQCERKAGVLFLSKHNFQYDWVDGYSETRSLGFHDFFFPLNDPKKGLPDSSGAIIFKNGVRIDYIENRASIKAKAKKIACPKVTDSTRCYPFDEFYMVPVEMEYQFFNDYESDVCAGSKFNITTSGGMNVRFSYLKIGVKPKRIKVLNYKLPIN